MHLTINGQASEVPSLTVAELLRFLGYTDRWIAVAVDGTHVPRDVWSEQSLQDSQNVEILSPMQGG